MRNFTFIIAAASSFFLVSARGSGDENDSLIQLKADLGMDQI